MELAEFYLGRVGSEKYFNPFNFLIAEISKQKLETEHLDLSEGK